MQTEIFSLASLGYFAKITFGDGYTGLAKKSSSKSSVTAKTIFVVDRSGSMGQYFCTVIRKIIPETMTALGYTNDE